MRVLLAGHVGQPFGGIASYCEALLNSPLPRQIDLTFVETSHGYRTAAERGKWRVVNIINAFHNILRFLRTLARTRPQLVHIMTAMTPSLLKHGMMVLCARAFGYKVILQPHCSISAIFPEGHRNFFARLIFRSCSGIIVLSQEWLALKDWMSVPVCHLPNGINAAAYALMSRPRMNADPVCTSLLYLGYLGFGKGTFDLIDAVARLNREVPGHFEVNLVGQGFTEDVTRQIHATIAIAGLQDVIHVWTPEYGEQKHCRIAEADVYVLPSHHEGMPISIIEAMSAGLPVVATTVGGIPDMLVDNETGLLVPPQAPEALANALRRLIESPSLRLRLGTAARASALERFDINTIVPVLLEIYRQVITE